MRFIKNSSRKYSGNFFISDVNGFKLRWFTPDIEIDLCGHATLAASHVIKTCLNYHSDTIFFETMSGKLIVEIIDDFYFLDFPSRKAMSSSLPLEIEKSLNIQPKEIYKSRDYLLIYENQLDIEQIEINRNFFDKINLGYGGVVVSSKGDHVDFVSRFLLISYYFRRFKLQVLHIVH